MLVLEILVHQMLAKIMVKLLVIIGIIFLPLQALAWSGVVERVIDGDTLIIQDDAGNTEKIRLYGIDSPEKNSNRWSEQAYAAKAQLALEVVLRNRTVEVIPFGHDRYARTLAVIFTDQGEIVQEILLNAGLAWVYDGYCKNCLTWKILEKQARELKKGLWADDNPIAPWQWRRNKVN